MERKKRIRRIKRKAPTDSRSSLCMNFSSFRMRIILERKKRIKRIKRKATTASRRERTEKLTIRNENHKLANENVC